MQEPFEKEFVESRLAARHHVDAIKCAGQFVCKKDSSVIDRISAIVNNSDDTVFAQQFPLLVDVDSFLRVTAFDILGDQLDCPTFSGKVD